MHPTWILAVGVILLAQALQGWRAGRSGLALVLALGIGLPLLPTTKREEGEKDRARMLLEADPVLRAHPKTWDLSPGDGGPSEG